MVALPYAQIDIRANWSLPGFMNAPMVHTLAHRRVAKVLAADLRLAAALEINRGFESEGDIREAVAGGGSVFAGAFISVMKALHTNNPIPRPDNR